MLCLTNFDGRPPLGGAISPSCASRFPIIQLLRLRSTIHLCGNVSLTWVALEAKPHRVRVDEPRGIHERSCITSELVVVPFSFQESFNFLHIRQPVNLRVYLPEGDQRMGDRNVDESHLHYTRTRTCRKITGTYKVTVVGADRLARRKMRA